VLARGASCAVGVSFTPQSQGSITNTLRFTDTARNSPQSVGLSGAGK
jgi:hypothetical protein